jgi:hypothetical protein
MGAAFLVLLFGLGACSSNQSDSNARERTDKAARKAGRAAHELADKTAEAAKKANREIKRMAGQAREGWKEGGKNQPKDRSKNE